VQLQKWGRVKIVGTAECPNPKSKYARCR